MRTLDATLSSLLLCLLVMLESAVCAVPNYFTGPAEKYDDPTSCPVAPCPACQPGSYREGCTGTSSGTCAGQCQTLPTGAQWGEAAYSLPCPWVCDSANTLVNNQCVTIGSYSSTVTVAMPLTLAQITSNIQNILASFQALAGCTGCPVVSVIPPNGIVCSNCQLSITATAVSTARRLLAVSTNLVVSIVQSSSTASTNTVAALTAESINTQLATNNVPATVSVVSPAVKIVVAPPPPITSKTSTTTTKPPPPPDTTQPSKPETTQPSKPETTQPSKPETTQPSKQDTTQPSKPDTTQPTRRDTTAPLPPAPSPPSSSESSNGAVIGGAVGGVVAVLLIIGGVVYYALKVPAQAPTAKGAASQMRVNARLMRGEQQVYTRTQRLPGQPFMESPRLPHPGAPARQPAQLSAQPQQFFHPPFVQPQLNTQRIFNPPLQQPLRQPQLQRPRFNTAPPDWA